MLRRGRDLQAAAGRRTCAAGATAGDICDSCWLYSPRWLLLYPGLALIAVGTLLSAWLLPAPRSVGGVTLDVHRLLYASLMVLLGVQSVLVATFTKVYAVTHGLHPPDPRLDRLFRWVTLETGLAVGGLLLAIGFAASGLALGAWSERSFGDLVPAEILRLIVPASLCLALGFQIVLSSFFPSVLSMKTAVTVASGEG